MTSDKLHANHSHVRVGQDVAVDNFRPRVVYGAEADRDLRIDDVLVRVMPVAGLEVGICASRVILQLKRPGVLMVRVLVDAGNNSLSHCILRPLVQVLLGSFVEVAADPLGIAPQTKGRHAPAVGRREFTSEVLQVGRPGQWLPGKQHPSIHYWSQCSKSQQGTHKYVLVAVRCQGLDHLVTLARAAQHDIRTAAWRKRDRCDKSWEVVDVDAVLGQQSHLTVAKVHVQPRGHSSHDKPKSVPLQGLHC
mmetsp:Transcript_16451/g.29214  ORF Transcript_16451/g.29214 Transcript_16451/m.29214 type:complete len:249 (+) Transcript_16451:633-1379(+)